MHGVDYAAFLLRFLPEAMDASSTPSVGPSDSNAPRGGPLLAAIRPCGRYNSYFYIHDGETRRLPRVQPSDGSAVPRHPRRLDFSG